jgi:hypothetical protein
VRHSSALENVRAIVSVLPRHKRRLAHHIHFNIVIGLLRRALAAVGIARSTELPHDRNMHRSLGQREFVIAEIVRSNGKGIINDSLIVLPSCEILHTLRQRIIARGRPKNGQ